jgi:hypothetical protein
VKIKIAFHFASFLLFACLLTAASGSAQTIAYRQNDLASDLPGLAHNLSPSLQNPWGMAFQPGQPFFTANSSNGRALSIDAAGGAGFLGFVVPNIAGTARALPPASSLIRIPSLAAATCALLLFSSPKGAESTGIGAGRAG